MASASAPLNAQPALPDDRAKQHLPPKSYADAVEEEVPFESANGINGTNDITTTNGASKIGSDDANVDLKASVLRIVDTGAPAAEEKKEENNESRPQFERQESNNEYSATVYPLRSVFVLPCY